MATVRPVFSFVEFVFASQTLLSPVLVCDGFQVIISSFAIVGQVASTGSSEGTIRGRSVPLIVIAGIITGMDESDQSEIEFH